MSKRFKRFQNAKNIFERMDVSRGAFPDFLRAYWIYKWMLPWLFILALTLANYLGALAFYLWPIIYFSMVLARYLDIFKYKGTTFSGYPAGAYSFQKYMLFALFPMLIGELLTALTLRS